MGLIRTGLFGGTFDPVHIGHVRIALEATEQLDLKKIIFIPNFIPPHKGLPVIGSQDRMNMLELAVRKFDALEVSDVELSCGRPVYTCDTVAYFQAAFPDREFYFLIGEDSYNDFHKWHRYSELMKMIKFVVYPRYKSYNVLSKDFDDHDGSFSLMDAPVIDISSGMIREKISAGRSISLLVDEKVEEYIKNRIVL